MTTRLDKSGHGSVPHEVTDAIIDALGGKNPPTVSSVTFREQAGPDTPPPGSDALFFDSADGAPKYVDDTGTVNTFGGAGSQPLKYEVVTVTFADISTVTGFAPLYLLPENETVLFSWPVVTATFNGTADGNTFSSAQACSPLGAGSGLAVGDAFDVATTSAAHAQDGLITGDPQGGSTVPLMTPLRAPIPGGSAVQLVIDFTSGNVAPYVQGSQGHLVYHLVIAVA